MTKRKPDPFNSYNPPYHISPKGLEISALKGKCKICGNQVKRWSLYCEEHRRSPYKRPSTHK